MFLPQNQKQKAQKAKSQAKAQKPKVSPQKQKPLFLLQLPFIAASRVEPWGGAWHCNRRNFVPGSLNTTQWQLFCLSLFHG
jgi:hypothetical protein